MKINSINNLGIYKRNNYVQKSNKISFGNDEEKETRPYTESLMIRTTRLFDKSIFYEGEINGQPSLIEFHCSSLFGKRPARITGNIGNKQMDFTFVRKKHNSNSFGTFNNKKINLELIMASPFLEVLRGKIGEDKINLTIPEDEAPTDSDISDVITLINSLHGKSCFVKDGKFLHIDVSAQEKYDFQITHPYGYTPEEQYKWDKRY